MSWRDIGRSILVALGSREAISKRNCATRSLAFLMSKVA